MSQTSRHFGYWIVVAVLLALGADSIAALERAERRLELDQQLDPGGVVAVENLIGSMTVRSGNRAGVVTMEARVVAEAETPEQVAALLDAVRLESKQAAEGPLLHVSYPTERHSAFRMPRSETDGLIAKWAPPLLHKKTVSVHYDDRLVQVGKAKGASAIAVHLKITLPLEARAALTQTVGTIHCSGLRADVDLEVVEGTVLAEQLYGALRARTAGGELTVLKFRGDRFELQTSSGKMELVDVEARSSILRSSSGTILGREIWSESMTVDTATGDVTLDQIESESLSLSTGSGRVDLASELQRTREASIRSSSGDVTLRVGRLAPFMLEARTESGSFKNRGVELQVVDEDERGASMRRGEGGAEVEVATVSGEVTVRPL